MPSVIKYEARPTFRDLSGRFTRANRDLLENRREWVRYEGRRFVSIAQRRAPKKSGDFADGIRYRTFGSGDTIGFTSSVPQPLGKWIIGGTKPHTILGRPYLAFFWERLNKRVVFRSVNHPGTKPNPFIRQSYEEWRPGAEQTFRRISTRWVTTVSG